MHCHRLCSRVHVTHSFGCGVLGCVAQIVEAGVAVRVLRRMAAVASKRSRGGVPSYSAGALLSGLGELPRLADLFMKHMLVFAQQGGQSPCLLREVCLLPLAVPLAL